MSKFTGCSDDNKFVGHSGDPMQVHHVMLPTILKPGTNQPPFNVQRKRSMKTYYLNIVFITAACAVGCVFSGCQVSVAGQNLPSAYFLEDDLQYFPKGPEFKLSREAAAQKEARAEAAAGR